MRDSAWCALRERAPDRLDFRNSSTGREENCAATVFRLTVLPSGLFLQVLRPLLKPHPPVWIWPRQWSGCAPTRAPRATAPPELAGSTVASDRILFEFVGRPSRLIATLEGYAQPTGHASVVVPVDRSFGASCRYSGHTGPDRRPRRRWLRLPASGNSRSADTPLRTSALPRMPCNRRSAIDRSRRCRAPGPVWAGLAARLSGSSVQAIESSTQPWR